MRLMIILPMVRTERYMIEETRFRVLEVWRGQKYQAQTMKNSQK